MVRLAPDPAGIAQAIAALNADRIVAFPTDTAYGLAVLADRPAAIEVIYRLKGRPPSLPLILLAADMAALEDLACFDPLATALARKWWPGPLTLVLKAGQGVSRFIVAADGTIGVRVPDHAAALALLSAAGPLATTSANRTGQPSPRTADAVMAAFAGDEDPAILLDGGPTALENDSSVLSLVGEPRLLRQGALSAKDLMLC